MCGGSISCLYSHLVCLLTMLLFFTILVSDNARVFLSSTSFARSNDFLLLIFLDVICCSHSVALFFNIHWGCYLSLITTIFKAKSSFSGTSNTSVKVN